MWHRTFKQRGEQFGARGVVCLENEYAEYFKAREKRIAKRAAEHVRNEDRAEFAARVNVAIGKMRKMIKRGMTLKDIDEIERILSDARAANRQPQPDKRTRMGLLQQQDTAERETV